MSGQFAVSSRSLVVRPQSVGNPLAVRQRKKALRASGSPRKKAPLALSWPALLKAGSLVAFCVTSLSSAGTGGLLVAAGWRRALAGAGWLHRKKFAEEGRVVLRRVVWAENTGRIPACTRIAAFCRFLDIQTEVDIG
jgi:hypothetical protein